MKKLIDAFIAKYLCTHKWNMHDQKNIFDFERSSQIPSEIFQTLICEKCGKIKKIEL